MRVNHNEFIAICNAQGIKVERISKKYAYINMSVDSTVYLPNKYNEYKIPKNLKMNDYGSEIVLKNCVLHSQLIRAIKLIRYTYKLGLKDAKDLCDTNWEDWRHEYERA